MCVCVCAPTHTHSFKNKVYKLAAKDIKKHTNIYIQIHFVLQAKCVQVQKHRGMHSHPFCSLTYHFSTNCLLEMSVTAMLM